MECNDEQSCSQAESKFRELKLNLCVAIKLHFLLLTSILSHNPVDF